MVGKNITSLTSSGMNDWYVQRVSALILLAYFICLSCFIFCSGPVTFNAWSNFFSYGWVKVFTVLAVVSLLAHSWVGIWTILTDYVHCALLRGTIQTLAILGYLICFVWTISILWS